MTIMTSNHQLAYDAHNDHSDPFDATPYDYAPYQNQQQNQFQSQQQPETRSAPPSGPPPAYYRIINKTYSRSLRPILLFVCFISLCYLLLLGIQDFRTSNDSGVSGKYKLFTIIQGVLFMAAAGIEILGLFSTYSQKLPLAKLYSFLSLLAFGAVIASEIIGIIVLYAFKSDVITQCSNYLQGNSSANYGWFGAETSNSAPETAIEANADCNSLWGRTRTWDIIWLIITTFLGAIFVMISFAYVRQLEDPSSVRTKTSASARYGPPQQQYGNWNSNYTYDPEAQQHSYPPQPYAPPSGPPPPPEYKVRPSMDDVDFDAKTPAGVDYGYGYVQEPRYEYENNIPRANRPGSSRSVRREVDEEEPEGDENKRKDSGETLRGDPALKNNKSGNQEDDDHVPRI